MEKLKILSEKTNVFQGTFSERMSKSVPCRGFTEIGKIMPGPAFRKDVCPYSKKTSGRVLLTKEMPVKIRQENHFLLLN